MDKSDKISLKMVQIPVDKFNYTVPQYLTQLKNHKTNLVKCVNAKNWSKVKTEEINASRILKQLKYLILEIDKIRSQVQKCDLEKFDAKIEDTKKLAIKGMKEYSDVKIKINSYNSQDEESQTSEFSSVPQIQSQFNRNDEELRQKRECMETLELLHTEIEEVQDLFVKVHDMVQDQKEAVNNVENNVEETQMNVEAGAENLKKALKYKKALYPLAGAILGTCLGGPLGLVIGLKAGGIAALGGGVVGFAGGKFLKEDEQKTLILEDEVEKSPETGNDAVIE